MRTPTAVIMAAVTTLAFIAACGGSKSGDSTPSPSASPAPIASAAPVATAASQAPTAATAPAAPTPAAASPAPPAPANVAPPPPQPPPPPPPQSSAPPQPVTLEVTAQNIAFDKTELHARAGAQVTAVLNNKDASVDHNLTFGTPGLPHGETCNGPCSVSQTFTAPVAGRYDFFCNIHSNMIGAFIVDP